MVRSTGVIDTGRARRASRVVAAGLATLVVVTTLVNYLPLAGPGATNTLLNVSTMVGVVTAAVLCQLTSRAVSNGRERWAWRFLALGFACAAAGVAVATTYSHILGIKLPIPSLADLFHLAFYPLAFAGILLLVRPAPGRLAAWMAILDGLVFTLGVAGLSWQLILAPVMTAAEDPLFVAVTTAYPLGDILLIFALCSLFLRWELGRVQTPALLLLASFTVTVVADLDYSWLSLNGVYTAGSSVDTLWIVGYALAGLAALSRLVAARETASTESDGDSRSRAHNLERTHFARMILPYLAFPAAAALIVLHLRRDASPESIQTKAVIGLALLLLGLVMVRQFLTILDNSRLSRSLGIFSCELEQRVAERTEELAVLNGVSKTLSHCLTTDEVLHTGLELACEATAVQGGVVWLKRGGGVEITTTRHLDETVVEQLDELADTCPEMRRALALRAPTLLDSSTIPALDDILDVGSSPGVRLLTVPLMSRDSVLGALGLALPPTALCDEAKLQLAEAIGAQLGVAVENAEQYDNARYLAERDSVTGLHNHRSLHNRLEQELNRAQRTMGVFSIAMMDLDGFKLFNDTYGHPSGDDVLRAVASLLSAIVRDSDIVGRYGGDEFMAVLPDTGSQGAVDLSQRVRNALLESPYLAPDGEAIPLHLSFGIASYPADGRQVNELIGLADGNLYSSKQRGGDMITAAEEIEEDRHGQGSGMFGVLDALVTAVDNKDRYTRHHSDDVTQFALAIAQQLSLSDESLRALRIAGLLHDVGKIGVPDRILRKPGRLTEDEMDVVKQHALLSEIIVKEVPNLTEVMAAVGSHHERWDGTGYPRGLKGAEIPFLGRILAVADAWSAMTTDRPYRKAMTPEAAREELVRGSGSQFDPAIVPAFLAVIDADVELLLAAG